MLRNYMENAVDLTLRDIMRSGDLPCNCEKCVNDIKAIALNNLKPMYVVTDEGLIYNKIKELNIQFRADIIGELTNAIRIVGGNPRH